MNAERISPRWQVFAMAVTTSLTIANIYYCQPILSQIGSSLHLTAAQSGNIPVLTQAGFGLGLFFLAPLGDMVDRKKLVIILELLLGAALILTACVTSFTGIYAASFSVGVCAVAVQIVVPMAATLATPGEKGKFVGIVFTGTLTGILGARIFSGYLTEWLSWRWVYGASAVFAFAVAVLVFLLFPSQSSNYSGTYGSLLRSTTAQFLRFGKLRLLSILGALVFGAFCSFWTTLTFHLSAAPFSFDSSHIGLFGFIAIGGAFVAPIAGRLSDKSSPEKAQICSVSLLVAGSVCALVWPSSWVALAIATLLLDVGTQATQVNNLAQIYALDEAAHSRINTVFMVFFFIGGSIGTYCGVLAWSIGAWPAVSLQLLAFSALAMILAFVNYRLSVKPQSVS